jgi:hypothetical protein
MSEGGEEWISVQGQLSPFLTWSPDGASLFAATSNPPQPSYVISVGERFGDMQSVRFDADGLAGGNGLVMWSPSTPPLAFDPKGG